MRLKCEAEVVMRPVPGCAVPRTSRPSNTFITIGKDGGRQINMLLSTAKNRNGNKYRLCRNILKIFGRFIDEGKATVSLKEPEVDVCISKADPVQLKAMLNVVRMVARGDDVTSAVGNVQAPSTNGMRALQTSMVIASRKDYPITTSFPIHLQSLTMTGISMKRLDERVHRLRELQTLELSQNLLSALPDTAGLWTRLSVLDLSGNQFTTVPPVLYRSCLKQSLAVLKMNSNQLSALPLELGEIMGLRQLHIDSNKLQALPSTIGSLQQLLILSAQHNLITQLPAGLRCLHLESLDLWGNPIRDIATRQMLADNLALPTLKEISARFIKRNRLAYSAEDLPACLLHYLSNARQCWCGGHCFESCARFLCPCPQSTLSNTVRAWDPAGRTVLPLECFLCSRSCLSKAQAYWR